MKYQWSEEYDKLLTRAIEAGKVQLLPGGEERRNGPRFSLTKDFFRSEDTVQLDIIDMSKTGYAFYSERKSEIGEEVPLKMQEAFEARAQVVGCDMEEIDSGFIEFKYRVRCQFTNPEHGMIILLLLFEDSTGVEKLKP